MNARIAPEGKAPGSTTGARLWIADESDAVFAEAIEAGVLSDDPEDVNFAGHYMYMHHDGDGGAWFKHRETRAYVTLPPTAGEAVPDRAAPGRVAPGRAAPGRSNAPEIPRRFAEPGNAFRVAVVLAGVFLAGALTTCGRGEHRVGTVRLNDLTAEFYAGAVREADSPEAAAQAARDWGLLLERSLDAVARRDGVVLLPVEAVAAGAVDYTAEVRATMQRWGAPVADGRSDSQVESGR